MRRPLLPVLVWLAVLAGSASLGRAQEPAPGFELLPDAVWHDALCLGDEVCAVGDFDGDGRDDIAAFARSPESQPNPGSVRVALSTGERFGPAAIWHDALCVGSEVCAVGDFDGDGKADVAVFVRDSASEPNRGNVLVALSTGARFGPATVWHDEFCVGDEVCVVGDFDGDGRDDIAAFVRDTAGEPARGDVRVALSTGAGFGPAVVWHNFLCTGTDNCVVADVNGDGRADALAIAQGRDTRVWVALSDGAAFGPAGVWIDRFCAFDEAVCAAGDFDGDGRADLVMFVRDSLPDAPGFDLRQGRVDVVMSDGTRFDLYATRYNRFCIGDEVCAVGDVNGDGKADLIAFVRDAQPEPGRGDVYVALSVLGMTPGATPEVTAPPEATPEVTTPADGPLVITLGALDTPLPPTPSSTAADAATPTAVPTRQEVPAVTPQPDTQPFLFGTQPSPVVPAPPQPAGLESPGGPVIPAQIPDQAAPQPQGAFIFSTRPPVQPAPPVAGAVFAVFARGETVFVTSEGDGLRLRAEPHQGAVLLAQMRAGTALVIEGGPVDAGGLRWWPVRLADGSNAGWVAQGLPGGLPWIDRTS